MQRSSRRWRSALLLLTGCICGTGIAAAQTDIAASVYGTFRGTTTGDGEALSPSNSAGVLVELRHISHPWLGLEATYAFNRADQQYTWQPSATCGQPCGGTPTAPLYGTEYVPANAHEITADYLVSFHVLNLRPFVLGGGGLLLNVPTGNTSADGAQNSYRGVLVYGAGLDFTVLPHLGIRGQYRGNLFNTPDLVKGFSSIHSLKTTSEPMLGVFVRF